MDALLLAGAVPLGFGESVFTLGVGVAELAATSIVVWAVPAGKEKVPSPVLQSHVPLAASNPQHHILLSHDCSEPLFAESGPSGQVVSVMLFATFLAKART